MSDSAPQELEPSPFEKMKALAAKVLTVSKEEVQKRERDWREERSEKKRAKKAA